MRIRILLFIFLSFIYPDGLYSQDLTVTGTVTSTSDGLSMPFVTVAVKGTTNAVTTDIDGKFSLQHLSADDSLVFSFVGYKSQTIRVGTQKDIQVKLESSTKELDEVVVTALGVNRQKRELGYSTEKIK